MATGYRFTRRFPALLVPCCWSLVGIGAVFGTCHVGPSGFLMHRMASPQLPPERPYLPAHDTAALSGVVERLRQGEEVLALFDGNGPGRNAAEFSEWLSARLTVGELQRLLLPPCDERCQSRF